MLGANGSRVRAVVCHGRVDVDLAERTSSDAAADVAALLTGPGAADVLGAALAADGLSLVGWTLHDVHARPGAETSAGYQVTATAPGVLEPASLYLLATTADLGAEPWPGVVRLEGDGAAVHVWRHPMDPLLPGLAVACDSEVLAATLGPVLPGEIERLELVAYRPLRRAVLRVTCTGGVVYLKVVRPERAAVLVRRHEVALAAGVPAPPVLACTDDGVVVLGAVGGRSVVQRIAATPPAQQVDAIDPRLVLDLVASLPAAAAELPRRASWTERLSRYTAALDELHPPVDPRCSGAVLERRIAAVLTAVGASGREDDGVAHGDLHGANILLDDDGRVCGVLDVDTLGPGRAVDDLACFVAHLAVLPAFKPAAYAGVPALVERVLDVLGEAVDPRELRARAAAVVVSLASGQRDARIGRAWVQVATALVAEAEAR